MPDANCTLFFQKNYVVTCIGSKVMSEKRISYRSHILLDNTSQEKSDLSCPRGSFVTGDDPMTW